MALSPRSPSSTPAFYVPFTSEISLSKPPLIALLSALDRRYPRRMDPKLDGRCAGHSESALAGATAAPVSHQKQPVRNTTNAIEIKQTAAKSTRLTDFLSLITVRLQARVQTNHFPISAADHLHSGERLRPKPQKFVAAIALSRAKKLGSGRLSFHSLWYPIVRRISDNHFASARPIASCGE
ncbi:hypothetical protein ACVWVY_007162 [Bradyrhizobium sp. URHC0002]